MTGIISAIYGITFGETGPFSFQALNTICQLINGTISESLSRFYLTQYITAYVIPIELFQSQTNSSILQFISSTTNGFLLSLSTIRNTTQSNALFSSIDTNYFLSDQNTYFVGVPVPYWNCNCATSATCIIPAGVFLDGNQYLEFTIPGFYEGCYIIEALLQSDLRCFYNLTCMNEIISYTSSSITINPIALDPSLLVRFLENSTIEELVNQLMVEEWNQSIIYENYYNECQPLECIYTYQTKNNAIYIITTLVGLIGGLTTALKLIVPRMVKFITFCIQKWTMRRVTNTVMPIIQT